MPDEYGQNRRNSRYLRGSNGSFGRLQLPSLPVGVLLSQLVDQAGPSPASGLIDVPGHLDRDDVAELARLQVLVGLLVALRAAALRADLHDLAGVLDRLAKGARVLHGVGHRLLDVGVAPGAHRLDAMLRVLEVGGRDDDGVDVLAGVEFVVVPTRDRGSISELLQLLAAGLAAQAPDVGDGDQLEVEFGGVLLERRDQAAPAAVGEADDADADAVVGAEDAGVAAGGKAGRGGGHAGCVQELSSVGHGWLRQMRDGSGSAGQVRCRTRSNVSTRHRGAFDRRTRRRRAAQLMTGRTTPALSHFSLRCEKYYIGVIACKRATKRSIPLCLEAVPEGARWFLTVQSGCVKPFEVHLSPCSCEHAV